MALGMVGGVFAYFTDTETSTGNTFGAGTLDLLVTTDGVIGSPFGPSATMSETPGGNGVNGRVVFSNLSPGDNGFVYWTIKNIGSIPGSLDIGLTRVSDDDNGINGPEDWADGILDSLDGTPGGDLGKYIRVQMRADLNNDGTYETTLQNGSGEGEIANANYPIGVMRDWNNNHVLAPGETVRVFFEFRLNTDIGGAGINDNIIQTDSFVLDATFELLQNAD